MLVISRRPTESIRIADNIEISIVEIRPGKVRLGIKAPREIAVWRNELYQGPPLTEQQPPELRHS